MLRKSKGACVIVVEMSHSRITVVPNLRAPSLGEAVCNEEQAWAR